MVLQDFLLELSGLTQVTLERLCFNLLHGLNTHIRVILRTIIALSFSTIRLDVGTLAHLLRLSILGAVLAF